jgi:tetratricopeptide (TPR) repeat protein
MAEEPAPTSLLDRLCADQGDRWHRGERVRAETYLERHPALAAEAERAVELVYNEVLLREELGETPQLHEYVQRFPQLATQLGRLFEVHGALEPAPQLSVRPTVRVGHTLRPSPPVAAPGELPAVPGYEVLGELGRGGMGVVYQARHLSLQRVVALKMILSGGHAGPEELARFRAEAEAQARLQHPNIVQIYEVGEAGGRPYVALEYVDGGSLAQRLAGTPQPARPAAQLVETLARAVHHAHQCGLIHRDLKPANVLVTADGTPKVTDFGLAKRLDVGAGPTRTGDVLGTPSYMAPEQAAGRGKEIAPATDVYALGAILYELLTGRPPFLAETPLETLVQVQSQEPVPPRRLQPKTPRDLETICLKCLQKEPRKRYADAEALADDLGRFLADRPIQARPVGQAGRLWRWCRRKPAVAALGAALLLGVAVGFPAVTYLWLAAAANASRAEEQSRRAEQNLKAAGQAIHKHFLDLSEIELSKEPGTHEVQKKLLEDALAYFQRFLRQRPDDPALLADVAEAHARLGKITSMIGSKEDALAEFQQAREIYEQLVHDNPADGQVQNKLALTYHHIGSAERERGHRAEALRHQEQARDIWEKLVETDLTSAQLRSNLAAAYHNIGLLEHEGGRRAEALRAYERARVIREELVAAQPRDAQFRSDLAMSYNNIGVLRRQGGKHAEALRCHEQARAIQERLAAANPASAEFQRNLAGSHLNIGLVHHETGRGDEALRCYEQARVLREKVAAASPTVPQYQTDLAQTFIYLGNVQRERGQGPEALRCYEQARAVQEKLVEAHPTVTQYQAALAMSHNNIGSTHQQAGRRDEARRCYEQARDSYEKLAAANPTVFQFQSDLALACGNLGVLHQQDGRWAEARRCYEEARNVLEKLVAANTDVPQFQFRLTQTCWNLGNVLGETKQWAEALHTFEQAYAICEQLLTTDPDHFEYRSYACSAVHRCGEVLAELDRRDEALTAFRKAIAHQRLLAAEAPQAARYRYNLACDLALCATLVGKSQGELTAQEQAERSRYADQSLEALRQAVAAGFRDVERLNKNRHFDPLRSRDDFKKLLADLTEKAKAPAR